MKRRKQIITLRQYAQSKFFKDILSEVLPKNRKAFVRSLETKKLEYLEDLHE